MALKIDAKFEGKMICTFKNDMKNLGNFHWSTWKSQNWDFDGILLSKVRKCTSLKFRGMNWLAVSNLTWEFWRILTRALKNLKNLHFNGLFLVKLYNVWAEKLQRSYIWWHWLLMQNLKENWFVLSEMTSRICQIFVQRMKNSNFILESEMAELYQNENRPDWPDAVWKLYFTLEINE